MFAFKHSAVCLGTPDTPASDWAISRGPISLHTAIEEHREAFEEEFGQRVSTSTVGRAISELPDGGWPLKKITDSL